MAIVLIKDEYLTDIADAIRIKNGLTNTYKPSEMAAAISDIEGGVFTYEEAKNLESATSYANPIQFSITNADTKEKLVFVTVTGFNEQDTWCTDVISLIMDKSNNVTSTEVLGTGVSSGLAYSILDEMTVSVVNGILTLEAPIEAASSNHTFNSISWAPRAKLYYIQ